MLFVILTIVLAILVIALSVADMWLVKTLRNNIKVQAAVTAELLEGQAATHSQALRVMRAKHFAALEQVHALELTVDRRDKTIADLEKSAELLNEELERAEQINMLEHGIKGGPPQR